LLDPADNLTEPIFANGLSVFSIVYSTLFYGVKHRFLLDTFRTYLFGSESIERESEVSLLMTISSICVLDIVLDL
jgi:hypothetical protein